MIANLPPELVQQLSAQIAQNLLHMNGAGFAVAPQQREPSAKDMGISYEDFCLSRNKTIPRPFRKHISEGTWVHEQRMLRQLATEGIPLDPPNFEAFMDWVNQHPKGMAGVENQRKAFVRLCQYHSIPVPEFARRKWADKQSVEEGRKEGILKERVRHFQDGPLDILRLYRSNPFRNPTLNHVFHHALTTVCLLGPRAGEPRYALLEHASPKHMKWNYWWAAKQRKYRRDVFIPERWYWDGPGPTVRFYLEEVRPKLGSIEEGSHYFINSRGQPFPSDKAWAQWMWRCIADCNLGYPIGPHAFRRFCATMRYTYGWTLEEVAHFIGDSPGVVERSYIDHSFVDRVGRRNVYRRDGDSKPALPPLWNIPKDLGLE